MFSLNNPTIKKQEVSCVPNTPNTTRSCIGALVRRRDGKIWVIGVAKQGNINLNKKCSKQTSDKSEHKRYCKGGRRRNSKVIPLWSREDENCVGLRKYTSEFVVLNLWISQCHRGHPKIVPQSPQHI